MVVSGQRVLITGCNGFIGRQLAAACRAEGWVVRGTLRALNQSNLVPAGVVPFVVEDVGPLSDWEAALSGVDAVVHLAAKVHQEGRGGTGAEYLHTNTVGTARLARSAAEAGVKRLVFLSTLKVNGEERAEAFRETDSAAPLGPYAVSKHEAENVLREISSRTGLQTVVLRPPLVYGPGVKANFLRLIDLVARGFPLPLKDLENRRSYIYVDNLVDGILTSLRHPEAAGKTYLIADDEAVSTPDLIRKIADALNVRPRLFSFPAKLVSAAAWMIGRNEDLQRLTGSFWADTSKIRTELGWRPRFTLTQGLQETASWYREFRSAKACC